jgi:hypothetical protein
LGVKAVGRDLSWGTHLPGIAGEGERQHFPDARVRLLDVRHRAVNLDVRSAPLVSFTTEINPDGDTSAENNDAVCFARKSRSGATDALSGQMPRPARTSPRAPSLPISASNFESGMPPPDSDASTSALNPRVFTVCAFAPSMGRTPDIAMCPRSSAPALRPGATSAPRIPPPNTLQANSKGDRAFGRPCCKLLKLVRMRGLEPPRA